MNNFPDGKVSRNILDQITPDPPLLLRAWAWITGRKIVCLQDYRENISYSVAKKDELKRLICYAYWFHCIGECILLEGGMVDYRSEACYIEWWRFA